MYYYYFFIKMCPIEKKRRPLSCTHTHMSKKTISTLYRKGNIPKALREQCWIFNFGRVFKEKCYIKWCHNRITVFDFHAGHNIPESKGGRTCLENLKPICSRCNQSMGDRYTIKEWQKLHRNHKKRRSKCVIS